MGFQCDSIQRQALAGRDAISSCRDSPLQLSGLAVDCQQESMPLEVGNASGMTVSTSQVAGAGMDIPPLDESGEKGAPPVVAALRTSESSDMQALRQCLSELEAEITRLKTEQQDDDESAAEQQVEALKSLLEEKRESERKLTTLLAEMQSRLDQQRQLIDDLIRRMDASAT